MATCKSSVMSSSSSSSSSSFSVRFKYLKLKNPPLQLLRRNILLSLSLSQMHHPKVVVVVDDRSFTELLSDLVTSIDEIASLSKKTHFKETNIFTEFSIYVQKLKPILHELKENEVIDSIETQLKRAIALIKSSNSRTSVHEQLQELTRGLGRCLGLVLLTNDDFSAEIKEKIGGLYKEMMNARFEGVEEEDEEKEEEIALDVDDVVVQLKCCKDSELKFVLLALNSLIEDKLIGNGWINDDEMIQILFKRLGSSEQSNRLSIILILRSLISENEGNKEKMVELGCLSNLVKSLSRNAEESREAVGLLLTLSDILSVRRRIGRIKGCIIMLVALLNGDDPIASCDAGKLLSALSSNTQDVLHMAEAGYFKPLVHYLKEGSDMSRILMATALSRMELTDQSRTTLGEEGSIKPLIKMFSSGKLEAKLSSLAALQNLSILTKNVQRLVSSGIVTELLQLLFSVTSVLMTLREPASAILASIAKSEPILMNQDVAQQMLSLLSLSSPTVQYHLLCALNSITSHSCASRVRAKMKENGALELLLSFLIENKTEIRTIILNLLYNLTKDIAVDWSKQLGETHLNLIVDIISASTSENEKAAAVGLLSNIPVSDKKATDILKKAHILQILFSVLSFSYGTTTTTKEWLIESIAGTLIRFTVPSDKKLQHLSAQQGLIPWLVKLLSIGSPIAKSRAATSLTQLSQNSLSLTKSKTSRWSCVPPSMSEFCEVHDGYCSVKSSFCLVKAGAISPLVRILEGKNRDADEAVLAALATLMQDDIWEKGSIEIANASGVESVIRVLEVGTVKVQEKALWMLERIFRIEAYRVQYGEPVQVLFVDLAQKGALSLKSTIAKILAHLELLQMQSSYF